MRGAVSGRLVTAAAFAVYLLLAVAYTQPLLQRASSHIANDRFDPVLNASILWWNATTMPFSAQWWTPPHYYPSEDVAAFTENLVGLTVFSAPLQWLTGDAILTYNLMFLLTWPLSALAVYLLVLRISTRHDAAFIAGLAFAFAPYRVSQLAHLQVLACYWLPVALFGLHAFAQDGRRRWLIVFGAGWLLQALSNGYFMLFGAILIAVWMLYFCSTAKTWRAVVPIGTAWMLFSLPLLPILLKYREVHARYGLQRSYQEMVYFSGQPSSWGYVSETIATWGAWLRDYGAEANLFPGLTAVVLVVAAVAWRVWRRRGEERPVSSRRRALVFGLGAVALLAATLTIVTLVTGPWRVTVAGITVRTSGIDRVGTLALVCGAAWLLLNARTRAALARRDAFPFYIGATLLMMALSLGPEIRSGRTLLVEHAPYSWLMWLPGFKGLRVPSRAWMLGALCLAAAGGLAFARLTPRPGAVRLAALLVCAAGVLADGWIRELPTATPPDLWPRVERRDRDRPLLELPLGPEFDAAATFRAVWHRRRVVNGVSGYEPPHYPALQRALDARDPEVLLALTSLGPLDVVVNGAADPNGRILRYVAGIPGAERVQADGVRTLFALPGQPPPASASGEAVALRSVRDGAGRHDLSATLDGSPLTGWVDDPARPLASVVLELATPAATAAVVQRINAAASDTFPTRMAVDVSDDGSTWQEVWEGSTVGALLLAVMQRPDAPQVVLPAPAASARFVRLRRLLGGSLWQFTEIGVHAPPPTDR